MERLTSRDADNIASITNCAFAIDVLKEIISIKYGEEMQKAISKFASYEDAEEQGRLIELPCVPGEKIYRICPLSPFIKVGQMWDGKIVERDCQRCPYMGCGCHDIGYMKDMLNTIREIKAGDELWILKRKPYFGKIYFFTREEAEAELKRREANG